jgi:tryptophan synthase alpha chain
LAHAAGLAFVPLIAPATDDARIAMICQRFVSPFVYAVLRYGVTGRATAIDRETRDYLERVKLATGRAVAAGFGIREGAQVEALRGLADCVVAGSVFIKSVKDAVETGQDVLAGISDCVRELKK